jgi:hypothetical protein
MLKFKTLRVLVPSFLFGVALLSFSSGVQAKRPVKNSDSITTDSQCLTGKEFNWLAKAYLEELQQIDSGLTLSDVKTILDSAGECATLDQYALSIQQYSDSLSADEVVVSNEAPVISGSAASSVVEGEFYMFTPAASDAEGDALTFSVQNLPSWAQFDTNTGSILGVPMTSHVGSYQDVVISVSDGQSTSSLPAINIDVTGLLVSAEASPLLTEIAGYTVYVGTTPDNLPDTIQLDVGNGVDVQADNILSAENTYYLYILPRDVSGNSVALANTDVVGYRVYIGDASNNLAPVTNFSSGVDKVYWVNQLVAGTYFVSITAYDKYGNETPLSNVARFELI